MSGRLRAVLLPLLALGLIGGASPQTTNLTATAAVSSVCTVSSPTPLAFGSYDPVVANHTAALPDKVTINALSVACTRGAPSVTISLGVSANTAGCPALTDRCLASSGNLLNYQIYTDSTYATVWEKTTTVSYASTTMAAHLIAVNGEIPGGQDAVVGANYSDSIVATVNF